MSRAHAEHFEDLDRQAHAAHLGMWVFLASESLLFAGLFALYAALRVAHPAGFAEGVAHAKLAIGSANTFVLLTSSYAVAVAVRALRTGRPRLSWRLTLVAVALGVAFLVAKGVEYGLHLSEGMSPGGRGAFYDAHPVEGLASYVTLYFAMTGLHALHVAVGVVVLSTLALRVRRGAVTAEAAHPLALGALYWHLVDVVWVFLWPMFYLVGSG